MLFITLNLIIGQFTLIFKINTNKVYLHNFFYYILFELTMPQRLFYILPQCYTFIRCKKYILVYDKNTVFHLKKKILKYFYTLIVNCY